MSSPCSQRSLCCRSLAWLRSWFLLFTARLHMWAVRFPPQGMPQSPGYGDMIPRPGSGQRRIREAMRLKLLLLGAVGAVVAGGAGAWQLSRIGIHQGYSPEQPIAFPHKVHAGDNKIPCLYCHSAARTSRHAGIPPASVCMNCHGIMEKQTKEIEKLVEAVQ